jgi:hypothetical protein
MLTEKRGLPLLPGNLGRGRINPTDNFGLILRFGEGLEVSSTYSNRASYADAPRWIPRQSGPEDEMQNSFNNRVFRGAGSERASFGELESSGELE